MKSIKHKLLLSILFIVSLFILGITIYDITFNKYFEYIKTKEMQDIIQNIQDKSQNLSENELNSYLDQIANKYSIQIDIKDINENILYSTHSGGKNLISTKRFDIKNTEKLTNDITKTIYTDKSTGTEFLSVVKSSDTYIIDTSISISSINDSKNKSFILIMIIFIPITILALILTIILSKKFTKPIIQISDKASEVSKLNFNTTLNIRSSDEIGILANNLNALSSKIETSLNELNAKNKKLNLLIQKEREDENLRREFISSVSHELKNPIAVISGFAQMLDNKIITSKEDIEYYISIINDESKRMSYIVNDLLDIYKMQSLTFKLDKTYFYIDELINSIIKKNDIKLKENQIILKINLTHTKIFADKIRIEQVIQNYLNNAISHVDKQKIISINSRIKEKNILKISVYNSGERISDDLKNIIWNGFVRGDKVRNHKEKRIGLGLYIVSNIIKLHNGKYGANNKDNGVLFYFELNLNNI